VALSGGVDSAVAAGLLAEAGELLVAVFMRNGVSGHGAAKSCCSLSDARDARAAAERLGLPFYALDLERPFSRLIDAFAEDYAAGLTPNPCVLCNNELKFGELMQLADELGCHDVITGHYARLDEGQLRRAVDPHKDQSYLLHGLTPAQRARARFPLGRLTKTEVRGHARRLGLALADKPDSADICFVPGGDYRAVVRERLGHLGRAGVLVDERGAELTQHAGVGGFTVGQRRGLGVALGQPAYVHAIDPESGRVSVGPSEALECKSCRVTGLCWHEQPSDGERLYVQLRHQHQPQACRIVSEGPAALRLDFERPSRDVTPGQYAVFYRADLVLGGGRIARERPPGSRPEEQP